MEKYRVTSDIPRLIHSVHGTPGAAHKAAMALSTRWGRQRGGEFRVEQWRPGEGWVEVCTYANGEQH